MKSKILKTMQLCARKSEEKLEHEIANLPESQRESVKMILQASKVKGPKGLRYPLRWIYECVLLRIKSRKGYKHLRKHQILVLPSIVTIGKYLKKIKPIYGFLAETFVALKKKTEGMPAEERRGILFHY